MTNRETLRSLAEQVEALNGPCRETDALISVAVKPENNARVCDMFDNGRLFVLEGGEDDRHFDSLRPIPAYTRSLDDAMSLVPERWRESYQRREDGSCISWCHPPMGIERVGQFGDAATPAIALTAASLRAIGEGL
jgi:hypothetical protein